MLERFKTAVVLMIIVGFCLFATTSSVPIIGLVLIIAAIAASEWSQFLPIQIEKNSKNIFIITNIFLSLLFCFAALSILTALFISACIFWLFAIVWVSNFPNKTQAWFHNIQLMFVGTLLITATCASMFYLWSKSPWLLLFAMSLVWSADSGAYFVGRKFGKTKLAPHVSPKKTIEGLLGGFALSVFVTVIAIGFVETQHISLSTGEYVGVLLISVVGSLISVMGDLFESMLKRKSGIKDSGTILPGHGGVLDRIDSLTITLPFFALGFILLGL